MSFSLPSSSADASVAAVLALDLRESAQASLQAAVQFARLADVITTQHQESQRMSQDLLDAVNKSTAATQKLIDDGAAFRADVRTALDRLKSAAPAATQDPNVAAAIDKLEAATAAAEAADASTIAADDDLGVNGFQNFTITDPAAAGASVGADASAPASNQDAITSGPGVPAPVAAASLSPSEIAAAQSAQG